MSFFKSGDWLSVQDCYPVRVPYSLPTWSPFEIPNSCGKGNKTRSHTTEGSINKTLLLNDTKLKNYVGNNKCASLTNISLFLISYFDWQTDRKYVFFLW